MLVVKRKDNMVAESALTSKGSACLMIEGGVVCVNRRWENWYLKSTPVSAPRLTLGSHDPKDPQDTQATRRKASKWVLECRYT